MSDVPPLTPKRANTRQRLLDAAVVVFAKSGVLGASVEEICEQANFTRGAFYSNFASKDELCLALMEHSSKRMYDEVRELVATGPADLDELWDVAARVFLHARNATPASILTEMELRLYAIRRPAVRQAFLELERQSLEQFSRLVAGAMARVGVRWRLPDADALTLVQAAFQQNMVEALLDDSAIDADRMRRRLDTLLQGLTEPVS